MNCQKCNSSRVVMVSAKCNDLCVVKISGYGVDGYVPDDMNMGGGNYVEINLCLECGHVQGEWPVPETELERKKALKEQSEKKRASWKPPARSPMYSDYLTQVSSMLHTQGHMGIYAVLPVILGEDEDVARICAGVQEVYRHPDYQVLAETIVDQLRSWEHYALVKAALKLMIPPKLIMSDDDDDDEEDD